MGPDPKARVRKEEVPIVHQEKWGLPGLECVKKSGAVGRLRGQATKRTMSAPRRWSVFCLPDAERRTVQGACPRSGSNRSFRRALTVPAFFHTFQPPIHLRHGPRSRVLILERIGQLYPIFPPTPVRLDYGIRPPCMLREQETQN